MKKISLIILLIITCFVGLYSIFNCGACIQEQDIEFLNKIENKAVKNKNLIKVSDVNSKNWVRVCASPGGYNQNFASGWNPRGKNDPNKIVINDNQAFITDKHDESAVVFYYGADENGREKIEVYRITPDIAKYNVTTSASDCLTKENAYFQVSKFDGLATSTLISITLTNK